MGISWNGFIYKILRRLDGEDYINKSSYNIKEAFTEEETPKEEAVV